MKKYRILDESELKHWVRLHPGGFIINSNPNGFSRNYVAIHKADCSSFTNTGHSTTRYSKYCFSNYQQIICELDKFGLNLSEARTGCPTCSVFCSLPTSNKNHLAHRVSLLLAQEQFERPLGNKKPAKVESNHTSFVRDPNVVVWIMNRANGVCEKCGVIAPFTSKRGMPYLEVHHITYLADGGEDTVENCIALCPNCHKQAHYSNETKQMAKLLRNIVKSF